MSQPCKKNRLIWLSLLLLVGFSLLYHIGFHKHEDQPETRQPTQALIGRGSKHESDRNVGGMYPKKTSSDDEETYFIKRTERVNPLDFDFKIRGPAKCQGDKNPFLVVLVMTMHDHVEERRAIRETWGSVVRTKQWGKQRFDVNILVLFMLGTPSNPSKSELAKKENEQFHDIVEASFVESYFNLTYKVLMGYKWVKEFCPSAKYIAKVDEDTFLNMNLLVNMLGTLDLDNTVFGPYFTSAPTERGGKHGITRQSYPLKNYPPHVKGNFYIMPTQLAMRVFYVSEYMPYICIEDAHITGILIKVLGGEHIGVSASSYSPFQHGAPDACEFGKPFKMAAQKVTPDVAQQIWKIILGEGKCP